MSFRHAQAEVDEWISRFQEGYWQPLAMLARVTEETGELAREINHRFGEKPKKPGEPDQDIGEEISDIVFVLMALANSLQIDMDESWSRMMDKVRTRDADRWTKK